MCPLTLPGFLVMLLARTSCLLHCLQGTVCAVPVRILHGCHHFKQNEFVTFPLISMISVLLLIWNIGTHEHYSVGLIVPGIIYTLLAATFLQR